MEPTEDIKNGLLLDAECSQNVAGPVPLNIICEPVPVEQRNHTQPQMKWKNAFGFVYQVRKKLSNQPQVYNEFIDIMRKVHNRTVETAQVVTVISDLFKDHPDLIRGFNAFLPDKHKIDVKVQLRVAVSGIPSPDSPSGDPNEREELPITTRIIKFTLNVRKRFEDDEKRPEKYKRFVEVLYLYKALSQQLQGLRKCKKKLKEEEVYMEVKKLFENNEDLLQEFSEYLPYNKKLSDIYKDSYKYCDDDAPYNCSCCSDVSSSGLTDVGKERPDEKRDSTRPNDEVTSSDDQARFHRENGIIFNANDVGDVKKFDVSSTRVHVKSEMVDPIEFNENSYMSVPREVHGDVVDYVPKDEIKRFKTELKDEVCVDETENYSEFVDFNKVTPTNQVINRIFEKTLVNEEIPLIHCKKEKLACDENDPPYFDDFNGRDENQVKKIECDTEKIRTPRKPLTPFKLPFPPNKLPQSIKRIVDQEFSSTPIPKRALLFQSMARSPSPPDADLETSVITRLAKRAADAEVEDGLSPPRGMSPPPKGSDRRLRNLRKRLRRLANL